MAKGLWQRLKDLPPIDWAALADRAPKSRKGQKLPRAWVERKLKSQRANAKARARAAGEQRLKKQVADRRKRRTSNLDAVMLNAMEPGEWYGRPDITAASGAKRNSVHIRLARWEREGWVERAENADYVPVKYQKGLGIDWQARGRAPQYLFRLTRRGLAERRRRAFLA